MCPQTKEASWMLLNYKSTMSYFKNFIATFSFRKFIQILSFPFFFGTTTIGDSYVASPISCMKHVVNNLSMYVSLL
jgi:hypothetical protein